MQWYLPLQFLGLYTLLYGRIQTIIDMLRLQFLLPPDLSQLDNLLDGVDGEIIISEATKMDGLKKVVEDKSWLPRQREDQSILQHIQHIQEQEDQYPQ